MRKGTFAGRVHGCAGKAGGWRAATVTRALRRMRWGVSAVGAGWVAFALCVFPDPGIGGSPCPASLGTFLLQFEEDRAFQVENATYPLRYSTIDVDASPGPRVVERDLSRVDVEAVGRAIYPPSAERERMRLVRDIEEVDPTRVIVRLRKPDTGYLLMYDSRRVHGCWRLVAFEDSST